MFRFGLMSAIAAALLVAQAGCENATGPDSEFRNARARWVAHAPASYSYTVFRGCFCTPDGRGPVTITVKNGVVETRKYADTGVAVPANYAQYFPSVDELFAQIDSLRNKGVARLNAKYDATYGYPTLVDVDVHHQIADDEFTYETSAFLVRQ